MDMEGTVILPTTMIDTDYLFISYFSCFLSREWDLLNTDYVPGTLLKSGPIVTCLQYFSHDEQF